MGMTLKDLFEQKRQLAEAIKLKYSFPKTNKTTGLICLQNPELVEKLISGLCKLPANFVIVSASDVISNTPNIVCLKETPTELELGFEFMVCDNEVTNLDRYFKQGIVPLIHQRNYMGSLLREFNPVKSEGNSFFYDDENEWSIFYALTRYLENHKFPYDNRNLVKNIFEM
jgi:hypothetical protein